MDKERYPQECCICKAEMANVHQTHNAYPVKEGRCCSSCNSTVVIPTRITRYFMGPLLSAAPGKQTSKK